MAVADEARPVFVDVELERADGAGALQDLRQRFDRLVVRRGVEQVAVAVDSESRAPHPDRVVDGFAPFGAVAEVGVEPAFVDDRRQVLLREPDIAAAPWALVPADDVDPPVAVLDDGGDPVHHRFHDLAAVDQAGVRGFQREAAVEGGDDAAALGFGHLGRTAVGERRRGLGQAGGRRRGGCGWSRSRRRRRRTAGIRGRCGRSSAAPAGGARRAAAAFFQIPSPGSAGWISGFTLGGR